MDIAFIYYYFHFQQSHPATPSPDYDQTPLGSLIHTNKLQHQTPISTETIGKQLSGSMKGTMGRCAAHEIAKANGDIGELESIDSFQLTNPSSPTPKPPSMYFKLQGQGPPTLKKPNRPIAITIGEYSERTKEPCKFDFITKSSNDHTGHVSDRLKSELEKTLSRSNLKNRNDFNADNEMVIIFHLSFNENIKYFFYIGECKKWNH